MVIMLMKKNKKAVISCIAFILLIIWAVLTVWNKAVPIVEQKQTDGSFSLFPGEWRFTRCAGTSEKQSMFYSIVDAKGRLVLIDGGWDEAGDIEQVMSVIRAHDNHVTAWIITHPHPDHVGAFNGVIRTYGSEVTIDHIYTVPVNRERYEETAQDYDVLSAYEDFLQLTEGMNNITFLRENDELDLIGMKMKVLHSWDGHTDELQDHLCNDGSMMFRLTGRKNSMLFCADVQKEMEQYILPAHEQELSSDFVQCAHHGNWGLSQEFYDIVSPQRAFIDAPASITGDTTGTYDCPSLIAHLQGNGVGVVTWTEQQYNFLFR